MKVFNLFLLTMLIGAIGHAQVDLPITFEDTTTNYYALVDFGNNLSSIVVDPTNSANKVVESIKQANAETWAGTVVADAGLANPIPFTATDTKMKVRVWSPDANTPVLLKVEVVGSPNLSVETLVSTTMAGQWETLEFDFNNPQPNTPALDLNNSYGKIAIFFNFGTNGATAGAKTYYWDDVEFVTGGGSSNVVDLPITFEDTTTNYYALVDFGNNLSSIVVDPTNSANKVVESIKQANAETWAGTVVADAGLANPIPFTATDTKMKVRVWSPDANTPVLLKVEVVGSPNLSVETLVSTTMAGQWETLEFDFNNPQPNTPALDLNNSYGKIAIFFNFGTDGATAGAKTYYWDDVEFVTGGGSSNVVDLPITFEDTTTNYYALVDFGNNLSSIVVDPTNSANKVVESIKQANAETWAGTVVADAGLANPIPFTATDTKIKVRVWSPDANTPVLLKVEVVGNPGLFVETLDTTTMAGQWETLEFDFSNPGPNTMPIDLNNSYGKIAIFFNFGTDGATAGAKTYYWDDVEFVAGVSLVAPDLPITFEDSTTVDYALVDFGNNLSSFVADPTNSANRVVKSIKQANAETWAGTVVADNGLVNQVPFTATKTKMSVRVWSPDANTPILLKIEDANDQNIFVETLDTTTVAGQWETLEFDFSNPGPNTTPIDLNNTYNKIIIFFNFGVDGATAGEKTYYWDDIEFLDSTNTNTEIVPAADYGITVFPNPATDQITVQFEEQMTQPVQLQIFDLQGRLVRQQQLTDQQTNLPIDNLQRGMYFIRMDGKYRSYVQKLIIAE